MSILEKALLSLNKDFFLELEYHLSKAFPNSPAKGVRHLWCDGIDIPAVDYEVIKGKLKDTKEFSTKAWLGENGQGRYEMLIKLGSLSLDKLLNDESLLTAIPSAETTDWITVDTKKKTIEIRLK